jgi:hypothetical protein
MTTATTYNYLEAVTEDVKTYIDNEITLTDYASREQLENYLEDTLLNEDSVTGNASGSYYCNAWKAEEALCHNWDILADALKEFGGDTDILRQGTEACDVTIRCYLLSQAISEVLDEMEENGAFDEE